MENPPPPLPAEFRLVVVSDHTVQTFPLHGTRWVIGRGSECDLRLRDPAASRRHVLLERNGDAFVFADLGGVNPLLLDGKLVRSGALVPGQTLLVGMTRLLLDRVRADAAVIADPTETILIDRLDLAGATPGTPARQELTLHLDPVELSQVFESLEWALVDLGSEQDVAEPLLDLALNVTGRRRGVLGLFVGADGFQQLAATNRGDARRDAHLPQRVLDEARGAREPFHLTSTQRGERREQLLVPLGPGPSAVLVLDEPRRDAPAGQAALRLARAVGGVVWRRLQEVRELMKLREEVATLSRRRALAHESVLASTRLRELRERLRETAVDTPVLLLGEPGSEFEGLARYAHTTSMRAAGPLVVLDTSTLNADTAPIELFGGGPNAPGVLERAASGTLLLIGAERLPTEVQQRLARCMRDGSLPRGGRLLPLDLRLVLGSTQDPDAQGTTWQHELTATLGLRLVVPPLRLSAPDIIALAQLFLAELAPVGGPVPKLTPRTVRALTDYSWPYNVQELRSVLEEMVAAAQGQEITPSLLPKKIQPAADPGLDALRPLDAVEKEHILYVLDQVGGNRARAAKVLRIAASTLYEKLKLYNGGNDDGGGD